MVGLGNPGLRYAATRHNVGFRVVEGFARRHGLVLAQSVGLGRFGSGAVAGRATGILEPMTPMNVSGAAVAAALARHSGVDASCDLVVVHDDLDLPLGQLRLRPRGGAGGHRGVASVIGALGHCDFARLRVGIGRPPAGVDATAYVLQSFTAAEEGEFVDSLELAVDALTVLCSEGIGPAMNRFNAPPAAERS